MSTTPDFNVLFDAAKKADLYDEMVSLGIDPNALIKEARLRRILNTSPKSMMDDIDTRSQALDIRKAGLQQLLSGKTLNQYLLDEGLETSDGNHVASVQGNSIVGLPSLKDMLRDLERQAKLLDELDLNEDLEAESDDGDVVGMLSSLQRCKNYIRDHRTILWLRPKARLAFATKFFHTVSLWQR